MTFHFNDIGTSPLALPPLRDALGSPSGRGGVILIKRNHC